MFLNFILTLCYAEQIFNKGYKQQIGQISIETDIFSRIHLTVGQKLVITVTNYSTHKLPLFMICRRFPSFKKVPDLFSLKSYNDCYFSQKCVADLNSYDFQKEAQKIIISNNQILEDFENQMFLTDESNANILVYLETKSDFNIYFDLKDKNSCFSQCQNGSSCENGICICAQGFIGGDCSIPVLNFQLQNEFQPDIVYFIDTYTEKTLEVDFTDRSSYLLQCISENPFLRRGQLLFNDTIEITEQSSQNCLLNSQTLNSQYQFQISPYYIFITNVVTHKQTYENNDTQKNTIIYVVTSIGVSLIFIIIYCFFKCRKTQQRSNNLFQQQKTYTSMKLTILRSINKYMPIQNYIDVIKKFPGLQDEQSCQICLETYQNDHKIRVAYCTHFFHAECIDQWIEKHEICPACRSSFNIETLNKFNHTENDDQQYNICTSTKQIINDQSQRKIRLFGNNKSSSSPIQANPLHQSSQI